MQPFYKIYQVQRVDSEVLITPTTSEIHWSLVERVVLAAPSERRSLADVQAALKVMESELIQIKEYLERGECSIAVLDAVQQLLNQGIRESAEELIRKENDNAVQIVLGELVRVIVQLKKNKSAKQ